jgi:hypothetical protein
MHAKTQPHQTKARAEKELSMATKSTPEQLDRSRPRAQPQGLLESTPVLFRLPNVQVHPLPAVSDLSNTALQNAPFEENPAEAIVPTSSSVVSQPSIATDRKQSWWEHWSSGVVLIVLLVAMYATCIMVLKSRTKPSNTLADQKTEFGDLTQIEVPIIQADSNLVVSLPQQELIQSNESALLNPPTLNTLTLDIKTEKPTTADDLVNSLSSSTDLANSLVIDTNSTGNESAVDQPMAKAQLLEPTQLLPLLPTNSPSPTSGNIQAQPVSSQAGQSPSLYDGANYSENNSTVPPATTTNLASHPAGSGLVGYNQSYSQPATANPTIPNLVSGSGQSATTSTVSTQTQTSNKSVPPGTRLTATPDANGDVEAFIRAYLELKRNNPTAQPAR